MPCHLQHSEPRVALEVLLINQCPAARLLMLPARARPHINQRNASPVCILRPACMSPWCLVMPYKSKRLSYTGRDHPEGPLGYVKCISHPGLGQHSMQRGSTYVSVGATYGSKDSTPADGDVIRANLEVWQHSQQPASFSASFLILRRVDASVHAEHK